MSDETSSKASLRPGWTTGACASAAAKAACRALLGGGFPDQVTISLPRGETPSFHLALAESGPGFARAGVIKDAGDDPDITHGATIIATLRQGEAGSGLRFVAGEGVGTVTRPGLPIAVGEPAINPVPRQLITDEITAMAATFGMGADFEIEISIPGGEALARRTWNPRLGILGGLSILGTTGVVVPYSCSAWIHSIQSGIDVARACGIAQVAGCTGNSSERALRKLRGLPEEAIIDMGDFAGGMLKYLRSHPVARVTIAGGFAKLAKLAAGHLDLHSRRSQVDMARLAAGLHGLGAPEELVSRAAAANTAMEVLGLAEKAGVPLANLIAREAEVVARKVLGEAPVDLDVLVFDRHGKLVGNSRT